MAKSLQKDYGLDYLKLLYVSMAPYKLLTIYIMESEANMYLTVEVVLTFMVKIMMVITLSIFFFFLQVSRLKCK